MSLYDAICTEFSYFIHHNFFETNEVRIFLSIQINFSNSISFSIHDYILINDEKALKILEEKIGYFRAACTGFEQLYEKERDYLLTKY